VAKRPHIRRFYFALLQKFDAERDQAAVAAGRIGHESLRKSI